MVAARSGRNVLPEFASAQFTRFTSSVNLPVLQAPYGKGVPRLSAQIRCQRQVGLSRWAGWILGDELQQRCQNTFAIVQGIG